MNEHGYRKMNDEVEIDLIELIWDLAMQWKMIVLCMLLCAGLFLPLMHMKEKKDYQEKIAKKQEVQNIVDEFVAKEQTAAAATDVTVDVDRAVMLHTQLQQMKKAQKSTVDYLVDWTDVHRLRQMYIVEASDASSINIVLDLNTAALGKKPVKKKLIKIYGTNDIYTFNAVSASSAGVVTNGKRAEFYVSALLLEDTDVDAVRKVISETLEDAKGMITEAAGPYTIRLITDEEDSRDEIGLWTAQLDYKAQIEAKEKEIEDMLVLMDEDQKKEYEKKTGEKVEPKELDEEEKELVAADYGLTDEDLALLEESIPSPRLLRKRYIVIGLFLGAFLYAGAFFLYKVLRARITSSAMVSDILGTHNFGEVHVFREAKGLGWLLKDQWIWELKNRKYQSRDVQLKDISERLSLMHHTGDKVQLCSVGALSEGVRVAAEQIAEDAGKVFELYDTASAGAVQLEQKLDQTDNVIFVLSYDESSYADANHLIELCNVYHVNILGTMLIES